MKHIYPGNVLGGSALYLGLTLGDILYYTADDTFTKADYPALRALLIECQGAGGGSGGVGATAASQSGMGGPGGGGGYARSLVLLTDIADTEAITVGTGGTAGTTAPGNGGTGEDSVFDTISGEVRGDGGGGGGSSASFVPLTGVPGTPGSGGSGTGDLVIPGDDGLTGFALAQNRIVPGAGGGSYLSGLQSRAMIGSQTAGSAGKLYGGGAQGAGSQQSQAAIAGQAGGNGIVIVSLLY